MSGGAEGERQADSPLSEEPHAGLYPRTLRSGPEPRSDAQPTEPPRHHLHLHCFYPASGFQLSTVKNQGRKEGRNTLAVMKKTTLHLLRCRFFLEKVGHSTVFSFCIIIMP